MANYPNGQLLLSTAEVKSLANLDSRYDSLIPAWTLSVQDQIERYCDRRFMRWQYNQWFAYDRAILLPQWPVTNILFLGTPVAAITVTDAQDKYSFNIQQADPGIDPVLESKLTVTDGFALTSTDFLFSTYTNLGQLKAAVEGAYPGVLTVTIVTDPSYAWSSVNTLNLRAGTGKTWYAAYRQNVLYRIDDETSRTLIIPQNVIVQFNALDYWFEVALNIVWQAGYTQATVPPALKQVAASVIRDMLNISKMPNAGLTKSISVQNYSESFSDDARVWSLINEKYAPMLQPYKRLQC